MERLYLVKIGGSVITETDTPDTAKTGAIDRLMEEIKHCSEGRKIILGHGVGSFAHIPAHKFKVSQGLVGKESRKGAAITQDSAARLHSIVMHRAIRAGINALSFEASTGAVASKRKIVQWDLDPLKLALKNGFLPLTHGDVVQDSKQGVSIASTEEVFRYLAARLRPYKIIIGTDVDGVFTADPKVVREAELIRDINRKNFRDVLDRVGGSRKIDVTGGMKSKLEYLYNMSKASGSICQIVNAGVTGRLQDAIMGRKVLGTTITAR